MTEKEAIGTQTEKKAETTHSKVEIRKPEPETHSAEHKRAEHSAPSAHSPKQAFARSKAEKRAPFLEHKAGTKSEEKEEHMQQHKTKPRTFQPKVLGKWSTENVQIRDYSLAPYINLESRLVPHSFGRSTAHKFEKSKINVVERLVNKIMRSGQGKRKMSGKFVRGRNSCGKKIQAIQVVEKALEQIERETNQNPIQVLITAIENVAVREDTTRIKKGGVAYTVAVDVAPMRRVDEALKNLALSGFVGSFNKKVPAHEALAKEILLAAKGDSNSVSIKRRDEVERIAMASR
jgi:small subunit ribosomal protein S7